MRKEKTEARKRENPELEKWWQQFLDFNSRLISNTETAKNTVREDKDQFKKKLQGVQNSQQCSRLRILSYCFYLSVLDIHTIVHK